MAATIGKDSSPDRDLEPTTAPGERAGRSPASARVSSGTKTATTSVSTETCAWPGRGGLQGADNHLGVSQTSPGAAGGSWHVDHENAAAQGQAVDNRRRTRPQGMPGNVATLRLGRRLLRAQVAAALQGVAGTDPVAVAFSARQQAPEDPERHLDGRVAGHPDAVQVRLAVGHARGTMRPPVASRANSRRE